MKKLVVLLAAAMTASGCGAPAAIPATAPAATSAAAASSSTCARSTVVLVRHGEKASNDPDTELSAAGLERAKRIATMLGTAGVTRLVATDVRRTQQTLAPLSEKIGKPVEVRPARDVDGLLRELRASPPGAVVVVAHHSNGIPRIARAFGVEPRGILHSDTLPENEFSRVLVLSLDCDHERAAGIELSSD